MKRDPTIPKEVILEEINCDFCGSENNVPFLESFDYYNGQSGKFSAVSCVDCGLRFTNPRPDRNSMSYYYPDSAGYYDPGQAPKFNPILLSVLQNYYGYGGGSFFKKILSFPLYLIFSRKIKEKGIPNFVPNGRLLDIGCSHGEFLAQMKGLGWGVHGVEMNHKAAEYARNTHGLEITEDTIDGFETNEKFDVITLRMVAEHVHSPKKVFEKCNHLLKPEGVLIIIIPDSSGFEAWLHKTHAYTLQLPTHLTHFTPKTIRAYLKETGFTTKSITHHNFDRDLIAPFSYKAKEGDSFASLFLSLLKNRLVRKTLIRIFVTLLSLIRQTSRMTVYAKKY